MTSATPEPSVADPFGTARLREATLRAWQDSPTRLTEDTNVERDLRVGAYRDRLFVELAQNAADAAMAGGVPGRVRVSLVDSELRFANTGAPLDARGVASLASLRASGSFPAIDGASTRRGNRPRSHERPDKSASANASRTRRLKAAAPCPRTFQRRHHRSSSRDPCSTV